MGPIDLLWHLFNLFLPAVGLGLIASGLAKLVWRQALVRVRWVNLASWTCGICALVSLVGLLLTGQDGRMVTYIAMVLAAATVLWWRGIGRKGLA